MRVSSFGALLGRPGRRQAIQQRLQEETKDQFMYSKPKMALLWGAATGASALAGVGISKAWDALALPVNSQVVGMAIGGAVGAATTYFALGDNVDNKIRLGATVAGAAAGAAAWNHFGLLGLKEGLGMAVGSAIGIGVGVHSVPEENRSVLTNAGMATLGVGFCHSAGIVGATGTPLAIAASAIYPVLGGAVGYWVARGMRAEKAREIARRIN